MNQPGLSKQIIIIAILPAMLVGFFLLLYYSYEELETISRNQHNHGKSVLHQIELITAHALPNDDLYTLNTLVEDIAGNDVVSAVTITDVDDNQLLLIGAVEETAAQDTPFLHRVLGDKGFISFSTPVFREYRLPDQTMFEEVIANVEVRLDTSSATSEKLQLILRGVSITLSILLLSGIMIYRISKRITSPIQRLTESVRSITAGDLDSYIPQNSTGELGVLETCINQMKNELKASQTDLEAQLDSYTDELQQTLEELEIRNAELDITRSKAIYANNAKSEFLANMSHEIRTPLSGIIGFSELLQGTRLSAQQKDYTDTIQKSARALLEIINDILDLSKIESGKVEISTSEFALIDIVEDIINLLSATALEKDIELFYRIETDVPRVIRADPFRLHQVLTNLVGNAIKFTEKGYVYLQVTGEQQDDGRTDIKFTVSDTGIGLSSDDKKRLFSAFTQADTSITRRFGGTGLGLVISRKLALLMNGEIGFDSTLGEGSTFWFTIPVQEVQIEEKTSQLRGIRIAFLCNHFIALQTFRTMFESFDCLVDHYTLDMLDDIDQVRTDTDIIVTFLSRKEINTPGMLSRIGDIAMPKPSLLIASTRSHKELRSMQLSTFDNALLTTDKIERMRLKLINTLNRNLEAPDLDEEFETAQLSHDWSNVNILIVDDNEVNLRLAEIILHKHKARVTTAMSGSQAIDHASMNSYDIIFMDLHMPGLDGYQTTQRIREVTPGKQPVIIALTANALPSEKDKVMGSDMNGIIIKPVSDAIMQKVVAQWVLKGNNHDDTYIVQDETLMPMGEKAQPGERVFSMTLAKEFTGNNEELALELFTMLRSELDDYRVRIADAVERDDTAALRDCVHKLHGASRCCGTTELREASARIEDLIDKQIRFDMKEETGKLLDTIQNVADYQLDEDQALDNEARL